MLDLKMPVSDCCDGEGLCRVVVVLEEMKDGAERRRVVGGLERSWLARYFQAGKSRERRRTRDIELSGCYYCTEYWFPFLGLSKHTWIIRVLCLVAKSS